MKSSIELSKEGTLTIRLILADKNVPRIIINFGSWKSGIGLTCNPGFLSFYAIKQGALEQHLERLFTLLQDSGNTNVKTWCASIPKQYTATVLMFPSYSLRMLRLVAGYSYAEQLLLSSPVLLWLIAIVSKTEKWTDKQLIKCLSSKRQLILEQLGFKPRKYALTVINKIHLNEYSDEVLTELKEWLNHEKLSELVHYPTLNLEQLKLLRLCPSLLSSKISFNHKAINEIEDISRFSQLLKDCIHMAEQLHQVAEVLQQFKKVKSVERFEDIHFQLVNRVQCKENFDSRIDYNLPPLVGTIDIVPITNSAELYLEGETQKHCLFSYHECIVSGDYYVYKILKPERATLGLQIIDGKPELDQIYLRSNQTVSALTINHINFWMLQKEKLEKSTCGQKVLVEWFSSDQKKAGGLSLNKTTKPKINSHEIEEYTDWKVIQIMDIEQSLAEYDAFMVA